MKINPKMIHMLELADKYVKAAIITLLKDTVENMPLVNEPIGNQIGRAHV